MAMYLAPIHFAVVQYLLAFIFHNQENLKLKRRHACCDSPKPNYKKSTLSKGLELIGWPFWQFKAAARKVYN
jgi:hypothetical protein